MIPDENKHRIPIIRKSFEDLSSNLAKDLLLPNPFKGLFPNPFKDLFPKISKDHFELLAKGGWYGHWEMNLGLIDDTVEDIKNGEYQRADSKMIAFFETTYEKDKSSILTELSKRSHVLTSAFHAHECGEYILSIPVFLAQVDGVCVDIFNVQAYKKTHKKGGKITPQIADYINGMTVGETVDAMLSPLAKNTPLTANPYQRENSDSYPSDSLNRHAVLHGESVDYGTKANSFKMISLLNYFCSIRKALSK